jgi:hypothetical protein
MGIRLALHRGAGRTAVLVRSAVASAAVGVAALSAAIVFAGSLSHLLASPALYGVTWDAAMTNNSGTGTGPVVATVERDRRVAAWATGWTGARLRAGRRQAVPGHRHSLASEHGRSTNIAQPCLRAAKKLNSRSAARIWNPSTIDKIDLMPVPGDLADAHGRDARQTQPPTGTGRTQEQNQPSKSRRLAAQNIQISAAGNLNRIGSAAAQNGGMRAFSSALPCHST